MTRKLIYEWVLIFAFLATYTSFVISNKTIDQNVAYAAQVSHKSNNPNDSVFVKTQDTLGIAQTILARLRGLAIQQSELCQVSKSDFDLLSKRQSFVISTQMQAGISITIAQPSAPLSASDLKRAVPQVHCEILNVFQELITQITSQVS